MPPHLVAWATSKHLIGITSVSILYIYNNYLLDTFYHFHYDSHSKIWRCFDRDDYIMFWNNRSKMSIGEGKTPEEAYKNLETTVYEKN